MDFVRRQIEVEAVEGVSIHPNCNAKKVQGKFHVCHHLIKPGFTLTSDHD
jgi:hypothetical protein